MMMAHARNPAAEAREVLGGDLAGRVLEPSPPAVHDEWFADDPANAPLDGATIVAPSGGDITWDELIASRPELESWAAERWLAGPRRLPPIPPDLAEQRDALHRLATYVIAPARHRVNGKFGLRWTLGGFGTPFFGRDRQIRVEGELLVVQDGDVARSTPITSLDAAAEFIGSAVDPDTAAEHDSPAVGDTTADLGVTGEVVRFLDAWWGMGTAALEELRADPDSLDPGRVQLWPGHFDTAMEVGDENRRASYGASPGDAASAHPYLYVSVWWPERIELDPTDSWWNAEGYRGARLPYAELVESDDHVAAAVEFFRSTRDRLAEAPAKPDPGD